LRTSGDDPSERGAIAVMVAVLLFVFVGAGALAIDVGSGWATKRDLVIGLDAAALAGATRLSELVTPPMGSLSACPTGGPPATTVAEVGTIVQSVAASNGTAAIMPITAASIDCSRGTVRVEGSQTAVGTFGGILRDGEELVAGGYAIGKAAVIRVGKVVPFTVCDKVAPLPSWTVTKPGIPTTGTMSFSINDASCGTASGNWAWFNTPIAEGSQKTLSDWLVDGYPGEITVPHGCTGPAASTGAFCNGDAGFGGLIDGNATGFTTIKKLSCPATTDHSDCPVYTIVIHDQVKPGKDNEEKTKKKDPNESGGGSILDFRPTGFLDVVIRNAVTAANTASITVEFRDYRAGAGESAARRVPTSYLCSVDGALDGDPTCG
jgi:hypothetical protein